MIELTAKPKERHWRRVPEAHRAWKKLNPKDQQPGYPERCGCIYLIVSRATRRVYVGSSNDYRKRFAAHRTRLEAGTHHAKELQREYDEHGALNLAFVPIERGIDLNLLECREQFWLWRYAGNAVHRLMNSCAYVPLANRFGPTTMLDAIPHILPFIGTADLIAELAKRGIQVEQ